MDRMYPKAVSQWPQAKQEQMVKSDYFCGGRVPFDYKKVEILDAGIKRTSCQGMSQDMKVQVGEAGLYAYPDYLVVCGEQRYCDATHDVLQNPIVLIEVLSPTTEQYDRPTKFDLCKQIESLREYVLVSQETPRVEHCVREADDSWRQQALIGLGTTLTFSSVSIAVPLADIYDRLSFLS